MFKIKLGIRGKLLIVFLLTLSIVIITSCILNNIFLEDYYIESNERVLQNIANNVSTVLDEEISKLPSSSGNLEIDLAIQDNVDEHLFSLDRLNQVSIEIVNKRLRVVFSSHRSSYQRSGSGSGSDGSSSLSLQPADKGVRSIITTNEKRLEHMHIFVVPKENINGSSTLTYVEKSNGYYIVITKPLQPIWTNISIMNDFYITSGCIMILVGAITMMRFSKTFTKPIIQISDITKNLTNLDFSNKITYSANDELGELSQNINLLSEQLEKNIHALKDEIEFQKLTSRNASHELKTPIAIIKGYTESLYYGIVDTEEEQKEYFEVIINECDRMNTLVQEMLTLSKLSANNINNYTMDTFSSIELDLLTKKVFIPLMEQKNIDFSINVEEFDIYGNLDLIKQCVYNFLSNAMKYGDGGKIILDIKKMREKLCIKVFNTGSSIPDELISKVFDTFYIVDEARTRDKNGHGLGLAIVKSIVEIHKGVTYCYNDDGGITFVIEI